MCCWREAQAAEKRPAPTSSSCDMSPPPSSINSRPTPRTHPHTQAPTHRQASTRQGRQRPGGTTSFLSYLLHTKAMPIPPSLTAPSSSSSSSSSISTLLLLLALLLTLTTTLTSAFLLPSSLPTSSAFSSSRAAAAHLTRRSAAFIEVGEKTRGGGGSDEEGGNGGGGGGGRATVITERAWNTSTLGALPANLESLSKSVSREGGREGGREAGQACLVHKSSQAR